MKELYDAGGLILNDACPRLEIPLEGLRPGDLIYADALAEADDGWCNVVYTAGGAVRMLRKKEYTGGACGFYGRGEREYLYRFIIPRGADGAILRLWCGSGELKIVSLRVYAAPSCSLPLAPNAGIKCVAHLGMTGFAPRNTLPAFALAHRFGCRECVTNINNTKDGVLVSLHNDTIDETSDGRGMVWDYIYDELLAFDFSKGYGEEYRGVKIPRLEDTLRLMARAGMRPVLRLSGHFYGAGNPLGAELVELVKKCGLDGRCTMKTFWEQSLEEAAVMTGHKMRYGFCTGSITREKIAWLKSIGDDVYFDLRGASARQEEVALALDAGIPVEAWIVNDFRKIVELESWGVTGFTTDLYSLDGCLY